jgi:hypothetical protein
LWSVEHIPTDQLMLAGCLHLAPHQLTVQCLQDGNTALRLACILAGVEVITRLLTAPGLDLNGAAKVIAPQPYPVAVWTRVLQAQY